MAMGCVGPIAIHQGPAIQQGRKGLAGEGFTAIAVHPIVQGFHINIGGRWQKTGLGEGRTASPLG